MTAQTVDTLHTVETPEGALLQFTVAGPIIRGLAWLIDVMIRLVIFIVLIFTVQAFFFSLGSGVAAVGIMYIGLFMLSWIYTTAFEAITGTTPGKRMFGLRVVHDNGTPISASGAIIRNFLRAVDGLPFINVTGLVSMLIDTRYRRLGDLAAGTLVIYKVKPDVIPRFDYTESRPPPEWLTRDERQAVVDFAERSNSLSAERQLELASVLSHLVGNEDDPVHTLKCWAHWIVRGQRSAEPASV